MKLDRLAMPEEVSARLRDGYDLAISISGGKDSDAMTRCLLEMRRQEKWPGRVVLVHADLGRAEHRITPAYVERFANSTGEELQVIFGKDLVDYMKRRMYKMREEKKDAPFWPSSASRYCTSDTKRSPISKFLRHWSDEATSRVICAMGLRAEESPARAKKPVFKARNQVHLTSGKRSAYDWLPILHFTLEDVWETNGYSLDELAALQDHYANWTQQAIFDEGVFNAHPAYALRNERLSCALCIFGNQGDLRNGAAQNPTVYREYVDMEISSGYSFQPKGKWLADVMPELLTPEQLLAINALKEASDAT